MEGRYAIHPAVGVARAGNSPDAFYLEPEEIGGLPIACDEQGNELQAHGRPVPVQRFKDDEGRVKRQAARFHVFRWVDGEAVEVCAGDGEVAEMKWTVHVASKKAAWYNFSELEGDRMLGKEDPNAPGGNTNSYQARGVGLRNDDVEGDAARQKLIIDPGPRTLTGPGQRVEFSRDTIPPDYPHGSFPPSSVTYGTPINTLGGALTDDQGRLLVLGGFGDAGGDESITSFAGANTWHDDISDGLVTCELRLAGGEVVELQAWVVVGSPKFAPELVNVVTLDDLQYNVGVRDFGMIPGLYRDGDYDPDYVAHYESDVEPLLRRPLDYIWVANTQSMVGFGATPFDPRDASEANRANREGLFAYFRRPVTQRNRLWSDEKESTGIPLMPLNSGSNSVSNELLDKFLTLTETQYFLLGQWAKGRFTTEPAPPLPGVHPLDRASVGNCVGSPMCPGIEVTWSTRNARIYSRPYRVAVHGGEELYREKGLSPSRDETIGGGCEPGDLTKRMAIPWQADFFQCTVQFVNFTDDEVNKVDGIPLPPTYYAYWWPPQSPMFVLAGEVTAEGQAAAGVPAGFQVLYPRGVNSFSQMINAWSYLGFVVNQNRAPDGRVYPYFAEVERNNDEFAVASVAVGNVDAVITGDDSTFQPVWYLKDPSGQGGGKSGTAKLAADASRGVPAVSRGRTRFAGADQRPGNRRGDRK